LFVDRGASEPPATGESERFGAEPADDLIWGRHPAQAALESDRPIHRIWCTPELRFAPRFLQLLREAKAGGVLVEEVTWARLGQLTGGAVHQGIVLQAAAAETLDLGTLIDGCRGIGEPPLLMAVDGLTDPHNLGAIVRSAEALGAHGLVLPQRRNAGLTGSVAKVAAGALEHLPVARVVNLNRSLEQLKEEGYRVVGLAGEGTVSLSEADLDGPLVVVTGSESQGLSMLTRKHCDQLIRIPLRGATPSLNASVATALLLYEVARRGWMQAITGNAPAPRLVRPQLPSKAAASSSAGAAPATAAATANDTPPAVDRSTAVAGELDDLDDLVDPADLAVAEERFIAAEELLVIDEGSLGVEEEVLVVEELLVNEDFLVVEEQRLVEEQRAAADQQADEDVSADGDARADGEELLDTALSVDEALSLDGAVSPEGSRSLEEQLPADEALTVAEQLEVAAAPAAEAFSSGVETEAVAEAGAKDSGAPEQSAAATTHADDAADVIPSEPAANAIASEPAADAIASAPDAAAPPSAPLELTLGLTPASPTGFQGDIQL
jgi:predicted rRNA methylase